MAAVNFGGILPRMPDLSHGNAPGNGCVSVKVVPRKRLVSLSAAVQWSLQGLFLSKILKLIWNLLGLWFRGYLSGRNDQRQGMVDD
ncbi:hypothetical protein D5086_031601 [Populus alba]|uniref:Uncharacterized protein n=1 Tax=Populus alba TaxID=43335 RepID=A0ACC4AJ41_POPAL